MTLLEIAKEANVSIGTVGRVIHNKKGVAPKTRKKIQEIIQEHDFKPNIFASQLKKTQSIHIGVLLPELDSGSGYWEQIYCGISKATAVLSPFNIKTTRVAFNRDIPEDTLEKGMALLKSGINALITAPVNPEEFKILLAQAEDIPYVFVDTPFENINPLFTIVQNPYQGGLCAGRVMKNLRGSGKYACVRMFKNAYNLQERFRGFKDFITQDSASSVIDGACYSIEVQKLYAYLDSLLESNPDIKGFFIPHAEIYLIAQYLVDRGIRDKTSLVGYDLLEANKAKLQEGLIDCIIGQRPIFQGMNAVYAIHSAINLKQDVKGRINVPIDIYYRENLIPETPDIFQLQIVNC